MKKLFSDKKYIYLIISSCLYSVAFIYAQLFWTIFLFLPLIFYIAQNKELTFLEGFLWGFTSFGLQEAGIFYSVSQMAINNSYTIYLLSFFIILYQALFSGLWFWFTNKLIKISKFKSLVLIFTTWLYFLFLDRYILFISGFAEGYPFANPLLVVANCRQLLYFLPFITTTFLLLIFIITASLLVDKTLFGQYKYIYFLIAILFWGYGFLQEQFCYTAQDSSNFIATIGYLPYSFYNKKNQFKSVQEMQEKIIISLKEDNNKQLFIAPESALFLCDLSHNIDFLGILTEEKLGKKVHLICGAIRETENLFYNTAYWLYNGQLVQWHDKMHALLLTETLPQWAQFKYLVDGYFGERPLISRSVKKRKIFKLKLGNQDFNFIPFICSEIFFLYQKPNLDNQKNIVILSLSNDSWIESKYLDNLMLLMHIFRAIEWNLPIIYCAYKQAVFISKSGKLDYLRPA